MRTSRGTLPLAPLLALALAGCGVANPYAERDRGATQSRTTATAADALPPPPAGGEFTGEPVEPREPSAFAGAGATPRATLRSAALLAGNWTSETAPAMYGRLAQLSVGDARATFEQIAAGARTDVQQAAAGSRSSATVEGIVVRGSGRVRQGVVVTREHVTSPELPHLPAEYRVTLATVERRGDVWAIASWSPKP